jgi:hypothetical protein
MHGQCAIIEPAHRLSGDPLAVWVYATSAVLASGIRELSLMRPNSALTTYQIEQRGLYEVFVSTGERSATVIAAAPARLKTKL